MPRLALLALALGALTAVSCAQMLRGVRGEEDPDLQYVRAAGGVLLKCAWPSLTTKEDGAHRSEGFPWSVAGCGGEAVCRQVDDAAAVASWDCRRLPLRIADLGEKTPSDFLIAAEAVEKLTNCRPEFAVVTRAAQKQDDFTFLWVAACGREFYCDPVLDRIKRELTMIGASCEETPASKERTAQRVVVDRLAVETGCAQEQIKITTAADWTRGTERAYRLSACGKPYVCTTAAGRTDCRPALDQATPAAGPSQP